MLPCRDNSDHNVLCLTCLPCWAFLGNSNVSQCDGHFDLLDPVHLPEHVKFSKVGQGVNFAYKTVGHFFTMQSFVWSQHHIICLHCYMNVWKTSYLIFIGLKFERIEALIMNTYLVVWKLLISPSWCIWFSCNTCHY